MWVCVLNQVVFRLWCFVLCCLATASLEAADFVGAAQCQGCHQAQFEQWQKSDHASSMAQATEQTVLGDFSNVTYESGQRRSRFFKTPSNTFKIETTGADGKVAQFDVIYTFGFYPLQQYLLKTTGGRLQAFDVAWDARPLQEGGQRWYQLQDDSVTDPEHPFFWTGYYQNWNSRCALCHSTDLQKQFNPKTLTFNTTFSDVNVACESCHGPGSTHISMVNDGQYSAEQTGLVEIAQAAAFHFSKGDPIARATPDVPKGVSEIDVCASCHSRRAEISEFTPGKPYHDQFQLELMSAATYFSDGQIKDEVFVTGSFLQSKMAQAGVTCSHCHDPHSGKLKAPGAMVCASCHQQDVFAQPTHTNNHKDADCLDCHMPNRLYMKVDWRRDHRFHRPTSANDNSASPCKSCHEDKSKEWLEHALDTWPKRQNASLDTNGLWAYLNQALLGGDTDAIAPAQSLLKDTELPPMLEARLLESMAAVSPQEVIDVLREQVKNSDPLVRRGVVKASEYIAPDIRAQILYPLLTDSVKSVRMSAVAAAVTLPVGVWSDISTLLTGVKEYETMLEMNLDHPSANANLAQVMLFKGNTDSAIELYKRALELEPTFLPALINYADIARSAGDIALEQSLLERAYKNNSDLASVNFAIGLFWVRQQQVDKALAYLKVAASLPDAISHYAFVYAIGLSQSNQVDEALEVLKSANATWPGDYNVLINWAKLAYLHQRPEHLQLALKSLLTYFPQDPTVAQLKEMSRGK